LVVLLGLPGCSPERQLDTPEELSLDHSLPAMPPLQNIDATEEQLRLYAAASDSLDAGDLDTALTALIALSRTEGPSVQRGRGMVAIAQIYFGRGDLNRAQSTLDLFEATSPSSAEAALLRGRIYLALDRPAEAEESLQRATRLDVDAIRALAVLAALQREVGRMLDVAETELALERRVLRHAHELVTDPQAERAFVILDALDAGFHNADCARAAASGLTHELPEVQAAALDTIEAVGGIEMIDRLRLYATDGGFHGERALELAAALEILGD
jgi:tetratricopeptide (TPR) repeat protein